MPTNHRIIKQLSCHARRMTPHDQALFAEWLEHWRHTRRAASWRWQWLRGLYARHVLTIGGRNETAAD
jgi:hypothetical protein